MSFSLNALYRTVGISKQAVQQAIKRQLSFEEKAYSLMLDSDMIRKEHPGCGVEKMYHILKPDWIGRDKYVELMMELGYRVKRKKNYRKTTIAGEKYWPNLIEGMLVDSPSTIWQSDLTYICIGLKHYYAVFIIDVYSKKIVGYCLSDHMRAEANVKALKMALKQNKPPLIHHSDRGSQYTYSGYVDLLKQHSIAISMSGSAQENAYAERVNRTIKEEYIDLWNPVTYKQLKNKIKKAVNNYNNKRPHLSIGRQTPVQFEQNWIKLDKKQRPIMTIFNQQNLN